MEKHLRIKTADDNSYEVFVPGKERRELYAESVTKAAEKFGNDSTAFRTITHWVNPEKALGSQYFWLMHLNACLPQHQSVISFELMELVNDADGKFFNGFYTYAPDIILRTEIPAAPKERFILEELVVQAKQENYEFSSEAPLRISGLELAKDSNPANPYGLLLKFGNDTSACIDERFAYSNSGKEIEFGRTLKNICTSSNGLSTICLGGGASLYTEGGFSVYADCICHVVVADASRLTLKTSAGCLTIPGTR